MKPRWPTEPVVAEDESETEAEAVAEGEATDTFQAIAEDEPQDGTADEYEYVEDTSGLEAEEEPATVMTPRASRPRRAETTAAAVSARKYRFRKRMLMAMAAVMVITAVLSFTVSPDLWWACGGAGAVTILYLAYLRRQTRIEEQVRRRRQQRMARSRLGVENTEDREFDVVPSRLRRPGAAVLDIDDEDPIFEHLDEVRVRPSLRPAAGGRAVGHRFRQGGLRLVACQRPRGYSAVGSASRSHREGQGFDSP